MGALSQPLDQARFAFAVLRAFETDKQPVAEAGSAAVRLIGARGKPHQRQIPISLGQPHEKVAVCVALNHINDGDREIS